MFHGVFFALYSSVFVVYIYLYPFLFYLFFRLYSEKAELIAFAETLPKVLITDIDLNWLQVEQRDISIFLVVVVLIVVSLLLILECETIVTYEIFR